MSFGAKRNRAVYPRRKKTSSLWTRDADRRWKTTRRHCLHRSNVSSSSPVNPLSLLLLFFLSLFLSSSPSLDLVLARDSYRRFCRSSFQELLCCPDVITGYLSFALRSRERRNGAGPLLGFPRMESFSLWFIISSGWSIMRNVIVLILLSVFENLVFFWSSSVCDLITIVLHRLKLLPFARS